MDHPALSHIVPDSVKQAIMGSTGSGAKISQLAGHTVEPTRDTRISTDYGVKQTSVDDWLRLNRPDQIGPSLLEDHHGRERV
jgi:catalase